MSPVDTLALFVMSIAVGGVAYLVGRVLGWSVIFCILVVQIVHELLKKLGTLTKVPFKWLERKRKDLELSRLMRETEQADARRKLRRHTEDLLEYPRHRTLPLRVITNPMIQ